MHGLPMHTKKKIITKKTVLDSALIDPTGKTAYLSFNRNFLKKDDLLYTKSNDY